jgi:hypothetical protein
MGLTMIEMQAYQAQINQAKSLEEITNHLLDLVGQLQRIGDELHEMNLEKPDEEEGRTYWVLGKPEPAFDRKEAE